MIPIRIFISSVQQEFAKERRELANYIRTDALLGKFFEVFIFEEMPASSQSAEQVYLKEVENSDIYLAILGESYGFEDSFGISPTEKEFDLASKLHKERLIFIKRVNTERHYKETALIKKAEQCIVRKSFTDYDELRVAVYSSLVRFLEEKEYLRLLPFDATLHSTATIDDIDDEKVNIFVERARKKRAFPLMQDAGKERVLKSLNLMNNAKLANAALLLFGKEPQKFFPTSEIKCVKFYTNTISKPIASYQVYKGSLFEIVDNAVTFVMSNVDVRVGERTEKTEVDVKFELPIKAVTECIVNSVCHRDYTSNGSVQVMLFPNRLEVWSPGRLPNGITTEQLLLPHSSIPTNPVLANPLYLAGYIERLGTGTSDIVDECISYGLKTPEFIQDNNFRVIIWRKNDLSSGENDLSSGKNDLSSGKNDLSSGKNDLSSGKNDLSSGKNDLSLRIKLNKKQILVLEYCRNYSKTSDDILNHIGVYNNSRARNKYINELIFAGLLCPTNPKLNAPNQRYITKNAGSINNDTVE